MILQLKIEIMDLQPLAWRRFLIDDKITFHQLHKVIQEVMGWNDYHLYKFNLNEDEEIGIPDPDDEVVVKDSRKLKVKSVLNAVKQKIVYTYDFGDNWEHLITVEKILENAEKAPVCIEGERACPPEDAGGTCGYEELLKIRKNKKHPDYKEYIVEWLGEDFDTEKFDIEAVNRRLKRLK
ncbi:MAG TPA: plasmid pRiA4b ORF-3 family protein [Nanoarchaeota archaeon]|nr:plasmid pRiA4b ORF-3 family protein [Nanoarchaeota archaeon]